MCYCSVIPKKHVVKFNILYGFIHIQPEIFVDKICINGVYVRTVPIAAECMVNEMKS